MWNNPPFLGKMAWPCLYLLWRHSSVTWHDPVKFDWPKVAQRRPHRLWKKIAWPDSQFGVHRQKTSGGGAHWPPLPGRGLRFDRRLMIYHLLWITSIQVHMCMSRGTYPGFRPWREPPALEGDPRSPGGPLGGQGPIKPSAFRMTAGAYWVPRGPLG